MDKGKIISRQSLLQAEIKLKSSSFNKRLLIYYNESI